MSRSAYDAALREQERACSLELTKFLRDELVASLKEERDALRAQNAQLIESLTRIQRVQAGLTEMPRAPKRVDPMPPALEDYISRGASTALQAQQRRTAEALYRKYGNWEGVMSEVFGGQQLQEVGG